jgi:plasmid maintenance system antidote protein VapI
VLDNSVVSIANPDVPKAVRAAQKWSEGSDRGLTIGAATFMCVMMTVFIHETDSASNFLSTALVGALAAVTGALAVATGIAKFHYLRHSRAGDIIVTRQYFLTVWDELCAEHNVKLNANERAAQINSLFAAAVDVQADVTTRASAVDDGNLTEEHLIAEARIRLRLLREVKNLQAIMDARRQLDALAPTGDEPWASAEEISKQVEILRARKKSAVGTESWQPDWAVPPGEVLVEALEERMMTIADLATATGLPVDTLTEITEQNGRVTENVAAKLESALGIVAGFWVTMDRHWGEHLARKKSEFEG